MVKLTEEERKKLLERILKEERERAERFKEKLEENGWCVSVEDAQTLLEIVEEFLENEMFGEFDKNYYPEE